MKLRTCAACATRFAASLAACPKCDPGAAPTKPEFDLARYLERHAAAAIEANRARGLHSVEDCRRFVREKLSLRFAAELPGLKRAAEGGG